MIITDRINKLRQKLAENNIRSVIISKDENIYYLSEFVSSNAFIIVTRNEAILATDYRYFNQAREQTSSFEVLEINGEFPKWLPELLSRLNVDNLAFEENNFSYTAYQQIVEAIRLTGKNINLIPFARIIESLRSIKSDLEIDNIKKACAIASAAYEQVILKFVPGISEREAAWKIERFMRENGSESMPFEIIVASGVNSAFPHAKPTDKYINNDEPVIIDYGAKYHGYCSDITRTIYLGNKTEFFKKLYDIVLKAQLTAISEIKENMSGEQADSIARKIIEEAGYKEEFGHGLGHGVGLEIHEEPRLGRNSSDILKKNMVITIEPGIYIPGWGGIRIEDTTLLNNEIEVLIKANKDI
ncbi:MAG: aminopeptidase P family protein [Chloroflexi bacterium]|nr:aminopeptidase P family protein [Chloroflexota bacterium]